MTSQFNLPVPSKVPLIKEYHGALATAPASIPTVLTTRHTVTIPATSWPTSHAQRWALEVRYVLSCAESTGGSAWVLAEIFESAALQARSYSILIPSGGISAENVFCLWINHYTSPKDLVIEFKDQAETVNVAMVGTKDLYYQVLLTGYQTDEQFDFTHFNI